MAELTIEMKIVPRLQNPILSLLIQIHSSVFKIPNLKKKKKNVKEFILNCKASHKAGSSRTLPGLISARLSFALLLRRRDDADVTSHSKTGQ